MHSIFFIFLLKLLIKELFCKQYLMRKEKYENNEFTPYIFNLSLNDQIFIYPSLFNTSSFYFFHFMDIRR